jgi:AcrR family transcriptional regulator
MNAITLNKKQRDILEAAKTLFWKYGFKKVSIEEICREAKTSKVTFYKFYTNKIEIAKAVLDNVVETASSDFRTLINSVTSTSDLLEGMLNMKKDGVHDISKEFLADFYADSNLGLKEHIAHKSQKVMVEMITDLKKLQEKGLIRKDMNIEFFLYFSKQMNSLMEDPYLISLFPTAEGLIMEITNLFTYGMTPRNDQQ